MRITTTLKRLSLVVLASAFWLIGSGSALASFDSPTIHEKLDWPMYIGTGSSVSCSDTGSGGIPVGGDNEEIVFNYFLGKGFNNIQAAAIVGNFSWESTGGNGINPHANQSGGPAHGIAQWEEGGRWDVLVNLANEQHKDPWDLMFQLSFVSYEFEHGYESVVSNLKKSTSVEDAVNQFMGPNNTSGNPISVTDPSSRSGGYENPGTPHGQERVDIANEFLKNHGGSGAGIGGGVCVTVNCDNASLSSLSSVRQAVVCTARSELAKWQSGNHPDFTTYTDGNNEEWCADFVSWVYMTAGAPFKGGESGGWRWPGVYNLANVMPSQNPGFTNHSERTYAPKAGDIAIHGSDHTNLVVAVSGDTMTTIGGNQGGESNNGQSLVSQRSEQVWASYVTSYVSPD